MRIRNVLSIMAFQQIYGAGPDEPVQWAMPITSNAARAERAGGDGNLEGEHRGGRRGRLAVLETLRKTAGGVMSGRSGRRKSAKIVAAAKASAPTELMRIRELDPQAACGEGTTVMQLFRVDDLPFGNDTTHLVFFDRHGWYCAHGRECPAVAAVRKRFKLGTQTK